MSADVSPRRVNKGYRVVRMYQRDNYGARTIIECCTLAQAQAHCKDPQTSSSTAKGPATDAYTAKYGPWFDGYESR